MIRELMRARRLAKEVVESADTPEGKAAAAGAGFAGALKGALVGTSLGGPIGGLVGLLAGGFGAGVTAGKAVDAVSKGLRTAGRERDCGRADEATAPPSGGLDAGE